MKILADARQSAVDAFSPWQTHFYNILVPSLISILLMLSFVEVSIIDYRKPPVFACLYLRLCYYCFCT